jgi:hypothetical protein
MHARLILAAISVAAALALPQSAAADQSASYQLFPTFPDTGNTAASLTYQLQDAGISWRMLPGLSTSFELVPPTASLSTASSSAASEGGSDSSPGGSATVVPTGGRRGALGHSARPSMHQAASTATSRSPQGVPPGGPLPSSAPVPNAPPPFSQQGERTVAGGTDAGQRAALSGAAFQFPNVGAEQKGTILCPPAVTPGPPPEIVYRALRAALVRSFQIIGALALASALALGAVLYLGERTFPLFHWLGATMLSPSSCEKKRKRTAGREPGGGPGRRAKR